MRTNDLLALAQRVAALFPGASLEKNTLGNLVVVIDGRDMAYLDLRSGLLEEFSSHRPAAPAPLSS